MARELKEIICKHLDRKLGDLDGCVLIDYRGLKCEETQDLRTSLRQSGVTMSVVHNRLARRVLKTHEAPEAFQQLFRGPTAVVYGGEGTIAASKSIVRWRAKNKSLATIKGGLFEGRALTVEEVEELATIPDLPALQAGVLSALLAPTTHLANAIQSLLSHFIGAVVAHRKTQEEGQGGA